MSNLLYETALLNSGYALKNPSEYARNFYKIFNGALGIPRNAKVEEIQVDLDEEEEEFSEDKLDEEDDEDASMTSEDGNYSKIYPNIIITFDRTGS